MLISQWKFYFLQTDYFEGILNNWEAYGPLTCAFYKPVWLSKLFHKGHMTLLRGWCALTQHGLKLLDLGPSSAYLGVNQGIKLTKST